MKITAIALLVVTPLSAAAVASPVDNFSIAAYERTIAHFERQTARHPGDQEAWLNLAMAYRHLNRPVEASAAFRRVLDLDDAVLQDRFGDDVWSHELARRALATQITSR